MGLRPRLVLLLLVPMMVTLALYAYLRADEERAERLVEFRRHTAVTSKAIKLSVEHAMRSPSLADAQQLMSKLVAQQDDLVRIRLFDKSLRVVLDANLLAGYVSAPRERLQGVIDRGEPDQRDQRREGRALYSDLMPLRPRDSTVEGVLEVVYVAGQLDENLRRLSVNFGVGIALLCVILLVITWFVLQRFVIHPLDALMNGIHRLGRGEAAPRVLVQRPDELGRVAEAFNQMSQRLESTLGELHNETERSLELQRQLRRTEALGMLGKFCSAVAHEVGTPLNVISGRAETALRTLPGQDPLRPELQAIITQTDRISKIIHSLLDPLRPRKPALTPTSLDAVLAGLLPLLRHTARRGGITLSVLVPPGLAHFDADPGQLQQVLINLVMNALEATPKGNQVTLEARPLSHAGRPGVGISVMDTGQGIAPDVLPRVFEPFFTTKAAGEGTGLGLAIAKDIVREHRGQIHVESTVGVGTTFTVWLPEARGTRP
jgi:signal transduction histidine kinase